MSPVHVDMMCLKAVVTAVVVADVVAEVEADVVAVEVNDVANVVGVVVADAVAVVLAEVVAELVGVVYEQLPNLPSRKSFMASLMSSTMSSHLPLSWIKKLPLSSSQRKFSVVKISSTSADFPESNEPPLDT